MEPSVECESRAQRTSQPVSAATVSEEAQAMEASSSGVGSTQTAESPKPMRPFSPPSQPGTWAMPQELMVSTPSARPTWSGPQDDVAGGVGDAREHHVNVAEHLHDEGALQGRVMRLAAPLGL